MGTFVPCERDQAFLLPLFALLTDEQIRRGVHRSIGALQAAIHAFIDQHNAEPTSFRWTKSADDVLGSIERYCIYNTPGEVA